MRRLLLPILFAVVTAAQAADAGSPRLNYLLHCSGCHAQDGSGNPECGVPTMRGALGHFLRLPEGRDFLVQVPGTSQSALSDAEVAEMLNWILKTYSREQIPEGFKPYTKQEVTALRARPLDDVSGRRADIVQRLREQGIRID